MFHSAGTVQSKIFVLDLILYIFNLGIFFFISLNVFCVPFPVKLLFNLNNLFFAKL